MKYYSKKLYFKVKMFTMDKEKKKKFKELYNKLLSLDENIDKTMFVEFISNYDKIKEFSVEKLARIFTSGASQHIFFILLEKNPDFLKEIMNHDCWEMELTKLHEKYDMKVLEYNPIDKKNISNFYKQLYLCLTHKKIKKIELPEDIDNYEENFKESSIKSFKEAQDRGEKITPERLIEYKYGIEYDEALNLVKKYGKDLEKFEEPTDNIKDVLDDEKIEIYPIAKMYGYNLKRIQQLTKDEILTLKSQSEQFQILKSLKELCECKDVEKYIKGNQFTKSSIQLLNLEKLEYELLTIFEERYQSTLYNPKNHKAVRIDNYEGEEISIYKIDSQKEMAAFFRVEGAYSHQKKENYAKAFENASIQEHGNCKVYVNNSNISIPRIPEGSVVYGYSLCGSGTLNLMAPWDIISNMANARFSIRNTKWDYKNGIQFQFPQNLIDNVRHSHDEIVSERLVWNLSEHKFKKDKPDYVVYEIDSEHNPENEELDYDKLWQNTKKAAKQLGIPIVLFNKEEILQNEQRQMEQLQRYFLGEEKDNKNRTMEEILEQLIVLFENNASSVQEPNMHGKSYKEKYFSDADRIQLHDKVFKRILELIEIKPKEGKKLLNRYKEICENELNKCYTNTNINVNRKDYERFYMELSDKLTRYELKGEILNVNEEPDDSILEYMRFVREPINGTNYFENKKSHSVEHMEKVLIFANKLAKDENLNEEDRKILLISAILHDIGRKDDKQSKNHAIAGAKIVKNIQKELMLRFDLKEDEIGMIQTIIGFHNTPYLESPEKSKYMIGKLAWDNKFMKSYNPDRMLKLCELLKDADALDRYRFAESGKLDPIVLKSKSARSLETREYARKLNEEYARQIIKKNYPNEKIDEDSISYVKKLYDFRTGMNGKGNEEPLALEELWRNVYKKVYTMDTESPSIPEYHKNENLTIKETNQISMDSIAKKTENVPIEDVKYIRRIFTRIKDKFLDIMH